jgi:hypothetical protein
MGRYKKNKKPESEKNKGIQLYIQAGTQNRDV